MIKIKGVYEIICSVTGYRYIGSSVNVPARFMSHRRSLNKGRHHCRYLQRAWNKYGEETFSFRIIRVISDRAKLFPSEQFYIDKYLALGTAYNCSPKADRPCAAPEVIRAAQLKVRHKHVKHATEQWADPESRDKILAGILIGAAKRRGRANPKLSQSLKLLWKEQPTLWANFVKAAEELKADPERCKAYGAKISAKWQDPIWRAFGLQVRRSQWTPELCKKQSEIMLVIWQDPTFRDVMLAKNKPHTLETIELCRAGAFKQNEDPEVGKAFSRRLTSLWSDPVWKVETIRKQHEGRALARAAKEASHV